MKLSVIGCGYLGAVHAAAMASIGHDVVGIDVDERKIDALVERRSRRSSSRACLSSSPSGIASGRLRFTTDMADAAGRGRALHRRRHPAAEGRLRGRPHLRQCGRSTACCPTSRPATSSPASRPCRSVPPRELAPRVTATGATLVWNPEFLREGGRSRTRSTGPARRRRPSPGASAEGERAADILREVYHPAVAAGHAVHRHRLRDRRAREGRRERVPRDQDLVHQRDGRDRRSHRRRRDPARRRDRPRRAHRPPLPRRRHRLRRRLPAQGHPRLLGPRRRARPRRVGRRSSARSTRSTCAAAIAPSQLVVEALGGVVFEKKITVLGAAFKPHSDDIRDSPALDVAVRLHGLGRRRRRHRPGRRSTNARRMHPQLTYVEDRDEALARRRRRHRRHRMGRVPPRARPRSTPRPLTAGRDRRRRTQLPGCRRLARRRLDLLRHGPALSRPGPDCPASEKLRALTRSRRWLLTRVYRTRRAASERDVTPA